MALYILTCNKCGSVAKRIFNSPEEASVGKSCKSCDGAMKRTPAIPSLHNKEIFSFGHQIKNVERFTDASQLYDERAHQDDRHSK